MSVGAFRSPTNITHVALLTRTNSSIVIEGGHTALGVEATNLQFAELDVEVGDEVLEDIAALGHQLGRLLIREHLLDIFVRLLEVREEENEDLALVARDLDQVDRVIDLVEVSVENLPTHLNSTLVESNGHRGWPLLRHNVDLVWTVACRSHVVFGGLAQALISFLHRVVWIPDVSFGSAWRSIHHSCHRG